MSDSTSSPHSHPDSWSDRIAERYRCTLAPVLREWFDQEWWRHRGLGEYREPIEPELLLDDAPESIWPGLMSCDLLPLISNTAGDWLCARVDQDSVAAEIVQWYHGGGDWIPWGNDLAEALVFDAMIDRLPGLSRRHAVPAEDPRPAADGDCETPDDPILQWAVSRTKLPSEVLNDRSIGDVAVARAMLDAQVAEVAVRCELVQSELIRVTRDMLEPIVSGDDGDRREQGSRWLFDLEQIPAPKQELLERSLGEPLRQLQDWDAAERHACRVTELAPDLAWAWEISGYAAERRGELDRAVEAYQKATRCSVFTDQSIRLETHWTHDLSAKFSAARLLELRPDSVTRSPYLSALCDQDAGRRRSITMAYWAREAAGHEAAGEVREAHRCLMAAGWDVGAAPIDVFGELMERIADTAEQSGQAARAELARTHRRCLRDRYGI